jgi:hypothetical protein
MLTSAARILKRNAAAVRAPILRLLRPARAECTIERVIPIEVSYDGEERRLQVPVYREFLTGGPKCAAYVRLAAQDLFGKHYNRADAWNLRYKNLVVADVKERLLKTFSAEGVLRPGMIVGLFNQASRYNHKTDENGDPVRYTHVGLYLGDDTLTNNPQILDQWHNDTRIQSESALRASGLVPREILDSPK